MNCKCVAFFLSDICIGSRMNDDLPLFIDSNFNLIKYVLIIFEKFDLLSPLALDNEEALLLKVNNLNPEYANEFLSCR
jgi:hypothetical protein